MDIPGSVQQKIRTKCAEHELVKLLLDKLVPVLLVDLLLALPDRALAAEGAELGVERPFADVLFDCSKD
jgi:hypothetical protein